MSFLLDTDVCSAYFKGDHQAYRRFNQYSGQLYVSTITVGELFTWVLRAKTSFNRHQDLIDFLNDMVIVDVDFDVAFKFGEVRAVQLDRGALTPKIDLFIAATALTHNLTLVTHNTQDFVNVPGLRLQDWIKP